MSILRFLGSASGRWARIIVGLFLVVLAVVLGSWVWAVVGAVFIAVGSFDFCLLAPLFGKPFQGTAFRKSFSS